MDSKISTGAVIAIVVIWIAVAAVIISSLPFVVLIFPLIVPIVVTWGGVMATKYVLDRSKSS